jgi:ubiquitin carboxyl-terminal hydrolase 7
VPEGMLIYQEIKAGMIEGLKIKQTFAQNELQDGDVLTYQVEISPEQYVFV